MTLDRVRGGTERAIAPAPARERGLVHAVARLTVAGVFLYHGLVPKLLARHPDELAILADGGVPPHRIGPAVTLLGVAEIAWALLLVILWRARWPFPVTMGAMALALVMVALRSPRYLAAAFNPVTLNVAVIALCLVGWLTSAERGK